MGIGLISVLELRLARSLLGDWLVSLNRDWLISCLVAQGDLTLVSGSDCVSSTGLFSFLSLVLGPGYISFTGSDSRAKVGFFDWPFYPAFPPFLFINKTTRDWKWGSVIIRPLPAELRHQGSWGNLDLHPQGVTGCCRSLARLLGAGHPVIALGESQVRNPLDLLIKNRGRRGVMKGSTSSVFTVSDSGQRHQTVPYVFEGLSEIVGFLSFTIYTWLVNIEATFFPKRETKTPPLSAVSKSNHLRFYTAEVASQSI